MSTLSKEQKDELVTSYAALALYDGDVSATAAACVCMIAYVFEGGNVCRPVYWPSLTPHFPPHPRICSPRSRRSS